jgi:hypothetical protein
MEEVVQGESCTTTASNGGKQTGNLFGKVNVVVRSGSGKRVITLKNIMYIPESPCNLVSKGKFYEKGFYLDAKENVIHNGKEIIANCLRLQCANVRVFETHPDNNTISRNAGYLLLAAKCIASSFEIWHERLLHAGEETVLRIMKAMGIEGGKPENWSCELCMLVKSYKQISREVLFRSKEAYVELHTDTIPVKPQEFGGYNYFMTIIDAATMYTWVVFLV